MASKRIFGLATIALLSSAVAATGIQTESSDDWLGKQVVALKSDDERVRSDAIKAIADCPGSGLDSYGWMNWTTWLPPGDERSFRELVRPALPQLIELLNSEHEDVVSTAIGMIACIGPKGESATAALVVMACDDSRAFDLRELAKTALLMVTPESKAVDPYLLPYVSTTRNSAIIARNLMQPGESDLIRSNSISLTLPAVVEPLIRSGHTKSEVARLVDVALKDNFVDVRALMIGILGEIGPDAAAALPALWQMTKDENENLMIRNFAAGAIVFISRDAETIFKVLHTLPLDDAKHEELSEWYNSALKDFEVERTRIGDSLGADPESLVSAKAYLQFGNGYYRREMLRSLTVAGTGASYLLPDLRQLLNDPDEETRTLAADAIRNIEAKVADKGGPESNK